MSRGIQGPFGRDGFERFLRHAPVAAALFDESLRRVAHNDAWAQIYPSSSDDVGRSHYEASEPKSSHQRVLEGEVVRRRRDPLPHPDATVDYVDWVATPWCDGNGRVVGALVYAERVTDRERIRRQLADREDFSRILFDRSPVGLNLCRLDGLWVESNPAFLDIIGYSREEADGGLTYWELTPREYDAEEKVQLDNLNTTGRYGPYEKEFIRKDGTRVPVRLNGFIVEREGEQYIWSLIEDIRARKELEEQLHSERLKAIHASKLATLGEMAAGFAHEINNPLAIIEGYAYVLRDAVDPFEQEIVDEALDSISHAVHRAAKIVSGLRKFARDDAGGSPEAVVVRQLIEDSLALCATRIRNHGVELREAIATDGKLRCNPIELSQVLINLVNNAFDAVRHEPGSWISLEAEDDGDEHIVIRVCDSGDGIDERHAGRLFHPFFTTKKVGEGTGLGLSISKGLVESAGGTLEYDADRPNTCFVLRMPIGNEEVSDA